MSAHRARLARRATAVSSHCAPAQPGTAEILDERQIREGAWQTEAIGLNPGDYLLVIADATGRALRTRLLVGAAADMPTLPADIIPGDLPPELRGTLEAAWLASQDDGWRWRLAAYQRIVDIDGYGPADLLRRGLLEDAALPTTATGR